MAITHPPSIFLSLLFLYSLFHTPTLISSSPPQQKQQDPDLVVNEVHRNINASRRNLGYLSCGTGNPIDDCWRCDPNWEKNRQRLADCAIGFGKNAVGGRDGKIYVVTDSGNDDPVTPKPGTLRHAVIQDEPLWIIFQRDMVIKLKEELIMNSFKTIDGRGASVHIAGGPCITIQYVTNIIIHGINIHDCKQGGNAMVRSSPRHFGWRLDSELHPLYALQEVGEESTSLNGLPRGIIHARSDLDLKPLWLTSNSKSKANVSGPCYLLAIPVGIKQMDIVDTIVQKFLSENFTIVLFHYDGKVDGWWNLEWSNDAIHIVAQNQTKWWFAKRFLHPSVVAIYDYIFLWDEDLGVEHFNPRRYLEIVKSEGLEISQPALDPNSTDIHHRITIRSRTKKIHRRVYDTRGSTKCSRDSEGPPCTGFVEGMAPVFSRAAWHCAWHLIQNDLVHGWGMDMKLGYCAQGDRTKNVGVVDTEYVVHQGIQTLGGPSAKKGSKSEELLKRHAVDVRAEIRRQSTLELQIFKERWEQAVKEDGNWVEPFKWRRRRRPPQRKRRHHGLHF